MMRRDRQSRVVQGYPRLGAGSTPDNPYPTIGSGARAVEALGRLGGVESSDWLVGGAGADELASPPAGRTSRPGIGRMVANELLGASEATLKPITRASEILDRADPHELLDFVPGVEAIRDGGRVINDSWDWYHQRGYRPGMIGGGLAELALMRVMPLVPAAALADSSTELGRAMDATADTIGAGEHRFADGIQRRFGPAGRAGLRGRLTP